MNLINNQQPTKMSINPEINKLKEQLEKQNKNMN